MITYEEYDFDVKGLCFVREQTQLLLPELLANQSIISSLLSTVVDGDPQKYEVLEYRDELYKSAIVKCDSFFPASRSFSKNLSYRHFIQNFPLRKSISIFANTVEVSSLGKRLSKQYELLLGPWVEIPMRGVSSRYKYSHDVIFIGKDNLFYSLVEEAKSESNRSLCSSGIGFGAICTTPGKDYKLYSEQYKMAAINSVSILVIQKVIELVGLYYDRFKVEEVVIESDLCFLPNYICQSIYRKIGIKPVVPQTFYGYHPTATLLSGLQGLNSCRFTSILLINVKSIGEIDLVFCSKEA